MTLSYGHCTSVGSTSFYILTFTTRCYMCVCHMPVLYGKGCKDQATFALRLLFVDYTLHFRDIRYISKIYILPNSGRRKFGHGTSRVTKCDINNDSHWPVIDMAKC